MNLKDTYNKIAQDWHTDHKADDWWVTGTDKFCALLPAGATVLDVGCGAGTKSKYLLSKGKKVTGIDFAEKQLEIAKQESPQVDFKVLDIYDLDNLKKSFDGVFAQAVLLHVPKKDIALIFQKLARKVNSGGFLYVAVKERRPDEPEEEIKTESDYGYSYERFFSYFNLAEIEDLFKGAGFQILHSSRNESGRAWLQVIGQKTSSR